MAHRRSFITREEDISALFSLTVELLKNLLTKSSSKSLAERSQRTAGQGLYPDLTLPDLHTFIRLKYIKVKFKLFKLEHIRTFSLPPKQLNVNCLFFPELKRISN